ncbi:GNAT family N-acetyltransferase [Acuticoccus sp. M5D2P5]|uniref:GNAT family N-acetyltransferase n=1 Tax=Acuticoccus kalidii TaxID=2910977 RepID=UPI001F2E05CB|nr:GNAT family N-acetyltransferase [Acuticoccus kalidii]MCF3936748.1 GNAT family N-acetyltransferase [Acuticoccus kalidii]
MIETERLTLTTPTLADVPALYAFLGDPAAMAHTHADTSLAACRRRIAVHERRRRRDGYAPWTVRRRDTGEIIGWGGLYDDPFDPGWGVELAYFFHPSSWGAGYGSELARATMRHADEMLGLPKVAAFAKRDNAASRRVLEKVGFRVVRYVPEMERDYYERPLGAN